MLHRCVSSLSKKYPTTVTTKVLPSDAKAESFKLEIIFSIPYHLSCLERTIQSTTYTHGPLRDSIGGLLTKPVKLYSPLPHFFPFDCPDLLSAAHPSSSRFISQCRRLVSSRCSMREWPRRRGRGWKGTLKSLKKLGNSRKVRIVTKWLLVLLIQPAGGCVSASSFHAYKVYSSSQDPRVDAPQAAAVDVWWWWWIELL